MNSIQHHANTAVKLTVLLTGVQAEMHKKSLALYSKINPKVVIDIITADEDLGSYEKLLSMPSSVIDVLEIDMIWTGALSSYLINLYIYGGEKHTKLHYPSILASCLFDDKLLAMPSFTDVGLFYYRTDLLNKYQLPVPRTWAELEKSASLIQNGERAEGNNDFWGYVWQGGPYEGLTCNALEWMSSNNGGEIIGPNKQITFNNENAFAAIERAVHWIGSISPPEVAGKAGLSEEISRNFWQAGNAAFMRNWSYAYALSNAENSVIKNKFSISVLPAGVSGKKAATLGGFQFAVAKHTEHPEIAADIVFFLSSFAEQKKRIKFAYLPTIMSLYHDLETLKKQPLLSLLKEIFSHTIARPVNFATTKYNEISSLFSQTVNLCLINKQETKNKLEDLAVKLQEIILNQ